MKSLPTAVGAIIHYLRERRDWTLYDLAAKTRLSVRYLIELERGRNNPTADTLLRIAHALEVRVTDLFLDIETLGEQQLRIEQDPLRALAPRLILEPKRQPPDR